MLDVRFFVDLTKISIFLFAFFQAKSTLFACIQCLTNIKYILCNSKLTKEIDNASFSSISIFSRRNVEPD